MPRAIIEDVRGGGVRVRIESGSRGAARSSRSAWSARVTTCCARSARSISSGAKLEKLPQTFDVPRAAFPELIGKTLPALAARIDVDVRADGAAADRQRASSRGWQLDVEQDGDACS